MIRRRLIAAIAISLAGAGSAAAQPEPQPDFAVNQLWSIKADPPTAVTVIINRIVEIDGQTVVHVTVLDAPLPALLVRPGRTTTTVFMPFKVEALRGSVDKLLGSRAPPLLWEGSYERWRAARGWPIDVSVPEALKVVFQAGSRIPQPVKSGP